MVEGLTSTTLDRGCILLVCRKAYVFVLLVLRSPEDLRNSISSEEQVHSLLSQLPRLNHDTLRSIVQLFHMDIELGMMVFLPLITILGCDSESSILIFGPVIFRHNAIKDSDAKKLLSLLIEKYIIFFQKVLDFLFLLNLITKETTMGL